MTRFPSLRFGAAILTFVTMLGVVSHAQAEPIGPVTIKGVRYFTFFGVPFAQKVKCSGGDGNILDSRPSGERIFYLVNAELCTIWADTGTSNQLDFVGDEFFVDAKLSYAFSGVESSDSPANGSAGGTLKCGGGCRRDEGVITYSHNVFGDKVVFVGTYKAKFPLD